MVKIKVALDQTQLNAVKQTPYLELKSKTEENTKAEILQGKAVVMIDPLTGRALGAADFFLAQQADRILTQTNPVSGVLYEVLPTTANVRIIAFIGKVTWAVTQPTPLDVVVTIDGLSFVWTRANPVSATPYYPQTDADEGIAGMTLAADTAVVGHRAFLLEGRSVRIQVRVTWAVTQPTPLVCKVRWAKR